MYATEKDSILAQRIKSRLDVTVTEADARTLRRCELTLQRWGEAECGDSNNYASVGIERDEETGIPYRVVQPHDSNKVHRTRIADREAGALRRASALAESYGLGIYHQSDPRGCALYIGHDLTDQNYSTTGVACCE